MTGTNLENGIGGNFSQCCLYITLYKHHLCIQKALNINFAVFHFTWQLMTPYMFCNAIAHYKYLVTYICAGIWWFNTPIFWCFIPMSFFFSVLFFLYFLFFLFVLLEIPLFSAAMEILLLKALRQPRENFGQKF